MVAACGVAKGGVEARRRLVASQTEGAKGMTTACGVVKGGVEARRRHVASQTEGMKRKATVCHVANRGDEEKGGSVWHRGSGSVTVASQDERLLCKSFAALV